MKGYGGEHRNPKTNQNKKSVFMKKEKHKSREKNLFWIPKSSQKKNWNIILKSLKNSFRPYVRAKKRKKTHSERNKRNKVELEKKALVLCVIL